jgi:hypothetical protein
MFTLKTSVNGMASVQEVGLPLEVLQKVRQAVSNNYMPSYAYKLKQKVGPFLQGYNEENGWIFIEFWRVILEEKLNVCWAKEYIDYLNHVAYGIPYQELELS